MRCCFGQVYAWNPSVQGAKSEDTVAIGDTDNELLTETPGWPAIEVEVDGHRLRRPGIRELG